MYTYPFSQAMCLFLGKVLVRIGCCVLGEAEEEDLKATRGGTEDLGIIKLKEVSRFRGRARKYGTVFNCSLSLDMILKSCIFLKFFSFKDITSNNTQLLLSLSITHYV